MKKIIKLTPEYCKEMGFDLDIKRFENPIIKRFSYVCPMTIDADDERTAIGLISTIDSDRDNEVIVPEGVDLTEFKRNPIVFYNHDRNEPIGKSVDIEIVKDGILAKTQFGTNSDSIKRWTSVKDGILKTFSIGIGVLESVNKKSKNYNEVIKLYNIKNSVNTIYTKCVLLEYSLVPLPSNIEAEMLAVSEKSYNKLVSGEMTLIGNTIKNSGMTKCDMIYLGNDMQTYIDNVNKMRSGHIS